VTPQALAQEPPGEKPDSQVRAFRLLTLCVGLVRPTTQAQRASEIITPNPRCRVGLVLSAHLAGEGHNVSDSRDTPASNLDPRRDTSKTLLQRLRAKEPDAWRIMVHLYSPLVFQWIARADVRGADADDISQEVFRAAATHLETFRHERQGDSFRGWLRTITRNMILLHFRRRGKQPQASGGTDAHLLMQAVADPLVTIPPEEDAQEVDSLSRRSLELVREEFEERTWQMFWLTFIEERLPVDVAATFEVSPAAVRKAKSRVLHRLKEKFADLIH
jgi:RNA polymerase sigma-70 factor (ECF subfamily)